MKLTKAKYNWLVAQYNYRKNKEQLIEISDEEYERLTNNLYPSQFPIIIGTWKGNMAQIENYRYGYNETSYIESEITFLNNDKTYDEKHIMEYGQHIIMINSLYHILIGMLME